MTLEEKYKIVYINDKRYYEFDLSEKLPFLDETVPYLFRYKDIEIIEGTWGKMTLRILEALDNLNPKTEDELLSIRYSWSKQDVFTRTKKINHTPYKNLYLNTNHTSSHSMMNIQCLLNAYNVDIKECFFLIRRHFIYEPEEVKESIRNKTIEEFKKSLNLKKIEQNKIDTIVKNFKTINKYLGMVSPGYDDFFLFDDYLSFSGYKAKTLEEVKKRLALQDKTYKITKICLNLLEDYYKNKGFYRWAFENGIDENVVKLSETEINNLFESLNTELLVIDKLYARMSMFYKREMSVLGEVNTPDGLFDLLSVGLYSKYHFKKPYISKKPIGDITNDQIIYEYAYSQDSFTLTSINNYIDKMHLKRLDNVMVFLENCSEYYVQVDAETMISTDAFKISESEIDTIKKELSFYINSFGPIDSETYNGYISLPNISGYHWNKYLLLGIARTYLNDVFEITTKGSNYKKQTYILDIKE